MTLAECTELSTGAALKSQGCGDVARVKKDLLQTCKVFRKVPDVLRGYVSVHCRVVNVTPASGR